MKNKKPIPKEMIPAFSYPDDENYIYDSFSPVTTQEIDGQDLNLITIDNICKFFEYFIKDDDSFNGYLEKFLSETIFENSLVKTFFEDEQGWHATSFNSKTGKFNKTELGCYELNFCRESFLRSVDFVSLYRNPDGVTFVKALGIRRDCTYLVEDILDLKYYLETGMDLRSASSVEKSLNKEEEICKPFEIEEHSQVQKAEEKAERVGINYEEFLKKNFWPLHEAVSLIVGEVPIGDNLYTRNLLTYKRASKAIESGELESEIKELWFKPLEGAEGYNSARCIQPRTFMKWRIENEGGSAPEGLLKFFNYDYWLSEDKGEWWSFDEATLLFLSEGKPPFPHEIRNVFEISEELNQSAKKLAQELLETKTRGIDGEWLYWKMEEGNNGIKSYISCTPISCEDFLKERIFLSRNALFRIVKKHEKIFSYIPKSLLDKALKIINKQDVAKIHSNSATEYLLKMIRENSLNLTLNKICTPQEFLKTLAKLPNESGAQNMKILMEIALNEIQEVGLSEEDSRRQSDIKEIRARFENLNEYSFLFKKDQELGKINFLSSDGDEDRGRLVDFIEWARGYKITIPRWLIENGPEDSESIEDVARPSKAPKAEVSLTETNHKICILALESLGKNKICNLGIDSVEHLWSLIVSLCEEDLDGFDNLPASKKKRDKESLSIIRKEIKKNLSLKELYVSRDEKKLLDTDYFFCWKTTESMKQKKSRIRDGSHPIEFRFGSFKNKLSGFKKIISEKS